MTNAAIAAVIRRTRYVHFPSRPPVLPCFRGSSMYVCSVGRQRGDLH